LVEATLLPRMRMETYGSLSGLTKMNVDTLEGLQVRKMAKNMVPITLYLPKTWISLLDDLVGEGFYPSRAEAIRMAIRDMLKEHKRIKGGEKSC